MSPSRSSTHYRLLPALALVAALATPGGCASGCKRASDAGETDFQRLFDGHSLAGWRGDPAHWRVDQDHIVGSTDGSLAQNSFLIHETSQANFVLRLQFKLPSGNSGINFRSQDLGGFALRGYQADLADAEYMGQLYEERGRGFLARIDPAQVYPHVDLAGWNDLQITADGPRIVLVINGYTTVDYREADAAGATSGVIGLQVHTGPAMEVRFRNIRLQRLP